MPDFCMCLNKDCHLNKNCFRFMAKPDSFQYYADFHPKDGKCSDFMPIPSKYQNKLNMDK